MKEIKVKNIRATKAPGLKDKTRGCFGARELSQHVRRVQTSKNVNLIAGTRGYLMYIKLLQSASGLPVKNVRATKAPRKWSKSVQKRSFLGGYSPISRERLG